MIYLKGKKCVLIPRHSIKLSIIINHCDITVKVIRLKKYIHTDVINLYSALLTCLLLHKILYDCIAEKIGLFLTSTNPERAAAPGSFSSF